MRVNRSELAEVFDVSTNTIDTWLRKGLPYVQKPDMSKGTRPERRQYVFDVSQAIAWRIEQARRWAGW